MANADRPPLKAPVFVVAITDEDYYDPTLFRGESPLHPDAIARITEGILGHNPKGLVLDVLIHPSPGESQERITARARLYRLLADASATIPIILVRSESMEKLDRRDNDSNWEAFDALTRMQLLTWAVPSIQHVGGYIRAIPEQYESEDGFTSSLPTVLGATVRALDLHAHRSRPWWVHNEETNPTSPWRIRFSGHFLNLHTAATPHFADATSVVSRPMVKGARSLLTDKIVLVGGTFHAGRDILPTVVGDMAGVFVWAEAIASWIRNDALQEPGKGVCFVLEFIVGVAVGLLMVRFGLVPGLVLSILIVGPLTVVFSLLSFGDRVLFINFLPSFVGVYLHYQIEIHQEIRTIRKELAGLSGI